MSAKSKTVQNIAVDDEGYYVGWKTDTKQYNFAVHMLLDPSLCTPSRCYFYDTMSEANQVKDYLTSKFVNEVQRVEICKVQYEYPILSR